MRVVFVAGRFNPATIGHRWMVEEMQRVGERAQCDEARIYATFSHDSQRNPLSPEAKLGFLQRAFPDLKVALAANPFEAGKQMAGEGVTSAVLVVGEDRQALGDKFVRYVGDLGLQSAGTHTVARREDAPSATAARAAIRAGDLEQWRRLAPIQDETWIRDVFHAVRREMGA